ncbi:type II toxin-antitoxin system RelE/ParE family toxin [Stenotrophomonas bentonitica]|uniref:type II toxin-antitoxin system RelE/ParE family toxin n=1 Tax=Stenotrophomonas bentonitica TaxID=1450134 RepID=UPI00345E0C2E
MTDLLVVKLTGNFERNLEEIGSYLHDNDAPGAFDALVDELMDTVIPNLERFPRMGRSLLARPALSVETSQASNRLRNRLENLAPSGEVREYVLSSYLILYAIIEGMVYLTSIRHHRQLSFDLARHWMD